jgi:hypothetical protein
MRAVFVVVVAQLGLAAPAAAQDTGEAKSRRIEDPAFRGYGSGVGKTRFPGENIVWRAFHRRQFVLHAARSWIGA